MDSRPIIFSAPMIKALLAGSKTMTRRLLNPPRGLVDPSDPNHWEVSWWSAGKIEFVPWPRDFGLTKVVAMPYAHGDRLWVREAFCETRTPGRVVYRADCRDNTTGQHLPAMETADDVRWKPSIHMPRWASRITLHVTAVKVERLQEISEADARAEGARRFDDIPLDPMHRHFPQNADRWSMENPPDTGHCLCSAKYAFASYWNSLHGPDAWAANPWVVAVSFRAARCNIDSQEGFGDGQ